MEYINTENWNRKEHFDFFRKMDYPQYNICTNVDVTNFLRGTKTNGYPFYYAMMYAATYAANRVENLRYRIRDGKVVLHDRLHPSFTAMDEKQDELFKYVTVDMGDDMREFVVKAKEKADSQKEYFALNGFSGRDDLIYITCIPWISFTSISHTISLDKDDAVPRISWGKYYREGEKTLLPFSLQVSHIFVDGLHLARYFGELQKFMDSL